MQIEVSRCFIVFEECSELKKKTTFNFWQPHCTQTYIYQKRLRRFSQVLNSALKLVAGKEI